MLSVTSAVYRIGADGSIVQRVGDVPAGEVVATTSPSGGRGSAPRPLGRTATLAMLDDAVVIGSADSAVVTLVPPGGEVVRHELPITPRAPTQAEFDEAVQATASMVPPPIRPAIVEQLKRVPIPERVPMISALMVDPEGLVWVQTTPPGSANVDCLVVDATGRVVARVRIPARLTLFEVGRDYVLGSYTDALGEMHVAVYRLQRR